MNLQLVLFDLDGTLADTAADIARATNLALAEAGRPPLSIEHVRARVSMGARGLIASSYADDEAADSEIEHLTKRLFAHYTDVPAQHTRVFEGLGRLLEDLGRMRVPWGVVSNKPEALVRPIVTKLSLDPAPICMMGGDSTPRKKPDPLPLFHACEMAGVAPGRSLYVGDAEIDVRAARAAGMPVAIAGFGYAPEAGIVEAWNPDCYADSVETLRSYVASLHDATLSA